jgi:UDP-arabinose 4-epimerase
MPEARILGAGREPLAGPRPRVLVTGGAGYIGSHTCKALAAAGYEPVAFDNLVHGHPWAVRWGPLVEGDLADRLALERALVQHRIEAVVHFAAYAYVGESMRAPGKYFQNNVVNTVNLLAAMATVEVRHLVFSSTCATYGVPATLPIGEDHPQRPLNPYGESKLFVERMLHWHAMAGGLSWAALRYFNAAGADPKLEIGESHAPETHLLPLAIQAATGEGPALQIFGTDYDTPDGTAVRDYVHVTDLADAHVRALRHLLGGGADLALNLGTGCGHSVREVIAAVERIGGCRVPVCESARRAGDPPSLVADARRAAQILEWQPRHSDLDTIVDTAWRWQHRAPRVEVRTAVPRDVRNFATQIPGRQ